MGITGDWDQRITRRTLLKTGGSFAAGITLAGIASGPAFGQASFPRQSVHPGCRVGRSDARRASCCGRVSRPTRSPSAAVCRPSRSRSATSSPTTRTSTPSSARAASVALPDEAHSVREEVHGLGPEHGTSTASRSATRSAPSGRTRTGPPGNSMVRHVTVRLRVVPELRGGLLHAVRRLRRRPGHRGRHLPRRLHLRGRRDTTCAPHTRRTRSGRSPSTGSGTPSTRPTRTCSGARRAPVAGHLGRPRVREQLRRRGPRPRPAGSRRFVARRARRLPGLLGAHAAARARKPEGPDLQLYRRFTGASWPTFNVLDGRQYRSDQPRPALRRATRLRLLRREPRAVAHDARRRAARVAARGPRHDQGALEHPRPADGVRAAQQRRRPGAPPSVHRRR